MTSRLTSEAFMPGVPMAMPWVTDTVPTSTGVLPASRTPRFTASASLRWFKLHGERSVQR